MPGRSSHLDQAPFPTSQWIRHIARRGIAGVLRIQRVFRRLKDDHMVQAPVEHEDPHPVAINSCRTCKKISTPVPEDIEQFSVGVVCEDASPLAIQYAVYPGFSGYNILEIRWFLPCLICNRDVPTGSWKPFLLRTSTPAGFSLLT